MLFHGFESFLFLNISSDLQILFLVVLGIITSSIKPLLPAINGFANLSLYSVSLFFYFFFITDIISKNYLNCAFWSHNKISACGQAKLTSPLKCLELITSYAPPCFSCYYCNFRNCCFSKGKEKFCSVLDYSIIFL